MEYGLVNSRRVNDGKRNATNVGACADDVFVGLNLTNPFDESRRLPLILLVDVEEGFVLMSLNVS